LRTKKHGALASGADRARGPRFLALAAALGGVSLGLLLLLSACASRPGPVAKADPAPAAKGRIAVFPVENLSGKTAPLREIRELLIDRLKGRGFSVLDDDTLNQVVTRHRIRYLGGVDKAVARALRDEAGVEAILVPSLELYDETHPPKVAMFCRLVSSGDGPALLWIDGVGTAGDDSPGILALRLVDDPTVLLTTVVDTLVGSLARHSLDTGGESAGATIARKFRPKIAYRSDALEPDRTSSVAVMPFFNKTERKYAGEIIALHMIRNLMTFQHLKIVEPGIVRQELLQYRIIMTDGVSLPETETILNAVNADLVLNGEVLDYRDYQGADGVAKVDFSVLFIERKTRRVVYSSYSQNQGDDGVVFFDWGRNNTAHAMAEWMARAIGERMVGARGGGR
jgi:hypothetical protein